MAEESYYIVIPESVLTDNTLSFFARILYGEIAVLSQKTGECWANNTYFANKYSKSVRAVINALNELKTRAYIYAKYREIGDDSRRVLIPCNNIIDAAMSCAEPPTEKQQPTENIVCALPLSDKTDYEITQEQLDVWVELYPAVDVMQALRNMRGWLDSNPARRKTRKGIKAFVTNWLTREQDKGGSYRQQAQPRPQPQPSGFAAVGGDW